jgi:hypothetical protein
LPANTVAEANSLCLPVRFVFALSTHSNPPSRSSSTAASAGAPTRSVPNPPEPGIVFAALDVPRALI